MGERVLALAIFLIGTLSTGLSSILPILMISPLMLADYQSGKLDMSSKNFKIITGVAAVVGLIGPAYGAIQYSLKFSRRYF